MRGANMTREQKAIASMLRYRRAHGSAGELMFIRRFIIPLPGVATVANRDGDVAAYVLDVGAEAPSIAFVAHTDSVHGYNNPEPFQKVGFDAKRLEFYVPNGRECLGADDAAGCYVLLRMIAANVPGRYFFFRGEEVGGIGSSWVADNAPILLAGISHAIQFDRRGTGSVITDMWAGRTCSDAFGLALCEALGMGHTLDRTGSFTDVANLVALVPECTNVSVGFMGEHSARETLDAEYLEALADRCIDAFGSGASWPVVNVYEAPKPSKFERWGVRWEEDIETNPLALPSKCPACGAVDQTDAYGVCLECEFDSEHDDLGDWTPKGFADGEELQLAADRYFADDGGKL